MYSNDQEQKKKFFSISHFSLLMFITVITVSPYHYKTDSDAVTPLHYVSYSSRSQIFEKQIETENRSQRACVMDDPSDS